MPAAAPATSHSRLSPEQVAHFRREGYVIPTEAVLPEDKFQGLKRYFEGMLGELEPHERPEHMDVPHLVHPELFEWLLHDSVLDLVEPLLGPDIAVFSSHFICKPGSDGKRVPWHEDSAYWNDMLSPMQVVTVWLAIDRSDTGNGCMRVIPRTHHNGYSEYEPVDDPANNVFGNEIKKSQYDASKAVDCILEPNHASLHDGKLMHGSNRNTAPRRRCGYTMRYVSAHTRLNPNRLDHHQLYLARGKDPGTNQWGDPTKAYPNLMRARGGKIRKGH
jgi:chlorinating enzyme